MIRKFRKEDEEEVLQIWLSASVEAHDFIAASFWESKLDEMKGSYLPSSDTYVYEDAKGKVTGFISLVDNYIAAVFVAPEEQGKGVGAQLIGKAKELFDTLELSVYTRNKKAVAFYQKHGFTKKEEKVEANTGEQETIMIYS